MQQQKSSYRNALQKEDMTCHVEQTLLLHTHADVDKH